MATRTKTKIVTEDYYELIKRFPLIPIRNDRHLREAHRVIDELSVIDEDELTNGQSAYLAVLSNVTDAYESPALEEITRDVSGLDVLRHLAEESDLTGSDIGRILGHRELGAKVLNGDRRISRENAKLLGDHFGVPSEIFLRA